MTKFVAYYNLCHIHDTKEFLGLSKDKDEGNIITTLGRNIIIVIKLSTQKEIRSWTVLDKLSAKVVYDKKSQQYVGVFGNRYIRCWDENTSDINKVKKIKFNKDIADLLCTESNEVLVLYNDGSSESLSHGINSRKDTRENSMIGEEPLQNIKDANVFTFFDGRKLLTYSISNPKTECTELVTVVLDDEYLKPVVAPVKFNLDRREQSSILAGYTVVEGANFPSLLTIWSDKRVFIMPLTGDVSSRDAPGNFVSMINTLNVDSPLSVTPISKHCVAIYGANSNQEGASLVLYNTKFKVIKAKQFFKIYFNFSRMWTVENHILLAMGQNLSVVSFRVSKEFLSEMIGSQVCNEFENYIDNDFINEEDELEDSFRFNPTPKTNQDTLYEGFGISRSTSTNTVFADGKSVPFLPSDNFEKKISNICKAHLHLELFLGDKDDFQIDLMANYNDFGFLTNECNILSRELEKSGLGEQEITEKLLLPLIKADLPQDIATCLRRYTNVSEKMLAKLLKYVLSDFVPRKDDIKNIENVDTIVEEEISFVEEEYPNVDIFVNKSFRIPVKEKCNLLNVILSCSVDVNAITTYLRKELNFKEAVYLIEHLYHLIASSDVCLEEKPDTSVTFDDDIKILLWLGIILNTHFQEMALSHEKKLVDLLSKWSDVILLYIKDLNDLQELSSTLYNIVNKKVMNKEKKYSKWYSIEEVKLY